MKGFALPVAVAVFLVVSAGWAEVRAMPPWDAPVSEPSDSWDEDYDRDREEILAREEENGPPQKEFDIDMKMFEDQKNKALEELGRN